MTKKERTGFSAWHIPAVCIGALVLLVVLFSSGLRQVKAASDTFTDEYGNVWSFDTTGEDTATLNSVELADVNLVFPEMVQDSEGKPYFITKLARAGILNGNTQVESVDMSNMSGVTSFNKGNRTMAVFADATNLVNVVLPPNLENIPNYTFAGCTSLERVVLPEALASWGNSSTAHSYIFSGCDNLIILEISNNNTFYIDEDVLYMKEANGDALIAYPNGKTEAEFTTPEGVYRIGPGAFNTSQSLKKLTVSDKVTEIGQYAFYGSNVEAVILPVATSMTLGNYAFANMNYLAYLQLPAQSTFGNKVFDNSTAIDAIVYPAVGNLNGESQFSAVFDKATLYHYSYADFSSSFSTTEEIEFAVNPLSDTELASLYAGNSVTCTASVTPVEYKNDDSGWNAFYAPDTFTWSINTDMGTINATTGVLQMNDANMDAVFQVTATTGDGSNATALYTIGIGKTPVSKITVTATGGATSLQIGSTLQMSATVEPENAENPSYTWTVTGTNGEDVSALAEISNSGVLTARGIGTVRVVASAVDGSDVTGYCDIRLTPIYVTSLTLSSAGNVTEVTRNGTLQFQTTVLPENATYKQVSYSVSPASRATITDDGLLTAITAGDVVVTARSSYGAPTSAGSTSSIVETTMTITINPIYLNQITIMADDDTLEESHKATLGQTYSFTAYTAPSNADNSALNWSINDSAMAELIVSNGNITVRPLKTGSLVLTATAADGGNATRNYNIDVINPATDLTLDPLTLALYTGDTSQLTAAVTPSDSTDAISYISGSENIATVSASGLVTAIAPGEAVITVTAGNIQKTCTVTVTSREQPAADKVTALIANLGTITLSRENQVTEARKAYDALNAEGKALVTNYNVLEEAEAQIKSIMAQRTIFMNGRPALTVKATDYQTVHLSWKAYTNADSYVIYRKTAIGSWQKIGTTNSTSSTVKATTGTTCYYTVCAVSTRWGQSVQSTYATNVTARTTLNKAAISKVTSKSKKLKVKWRKVTGASGYQVYRATSKNGKYKLVKTTKAKTTSFTNKKLKGNKRYYYKVRAYRKVNGKKVTGAFSAVKSGKTKK